MIGNYWEERKEGRVMRRLLTVTALVLVAGLMVVPAALAQEDDELIV
jgi:hypothetical protein